MVVGVGSEPTYATRADLQSAAFNHSPPHQYKYHNIYNLYYCLIIAN